MIEQERVCGWLLSSILLITLSLTGCGTYASRSQQCSNGTCTTSKKKCIDYQCEIIECTQGSCTTHYTYEGKEHGLIAGQLNQINRSTPTGIQYPSRQNGPAFKSSTDRRQAYTINMMAGQFRCAGLKYNETFTTLWNIRSDGSAIRNVGGFKDGINGRIWIRIVKKTGSDKAYIETYLSQSAIGKFNPIHRYEILHRNAFMDGLRTCIRQ